MNRRDVLGAVLGCASGASICVDSAVADTPMHRRRHPLIGRLSEGGPADYTIFREAMRRLGHSELAIEERPARGDAAKLATYAAELVGLPVDVLWTTGTLATQIAKDASRTVPIVMVSADALGAGLVGNLARPGGNLTGLTLVGTELAAKRLELMRRLDPKVRRVIALAHGPGVGTVPIVSDWMERSRSAADALRLDFRFVELALDPVAWDQEIGALATPGTALTLMESPFLLQQRELLGRITLKHRLPSVYAFQEHVQAGGLFSYGVTNRYITERVAYYLSRILNGAKAGDLPVEQPTKYELAINRQTAVALGLTIPRAILVGADLLIG